MVVLTTMIIYGLTTTSRYDWDTGISLGSVKPFDQAICYLDPAFDDWENTDAFRIIISIVFLGFGMINRIRRLYHAPNLIMAKARNRISQISRCFLMYIYGQGSADSVVACLAAVMVYRPLLALFLTVRLLTDGLTSMAFEVRGSSPHQLKKPTDFRGMLGDTCFYLGEPESMG
jgi:hypothetical protein